MDDEETTSTAKADREVLIEQAIRARGFWNDDAAPHERHVNPENDEEIVAWAWHWGLLP